MYLQKNLSQKDESNLKIVNRYVIKKWGYIMHSFYIKCKPSGMCGINYLLFNRESN